MKIIHENKKYCKCDFCVKSFSQAGNLKTHINSVHNGQKDHKCDSCGKSFTHGANLKTHINLVHNGKKITNVNHVEIIFPSRKIEDTH